MYSIWPLLHKKQDFIGNSPTFNLHVFFSFPFFFVCVCCFSCELRGGGKGGGGLILQTNRTFSSIKVSKSNQIKSKAEQKGKKIYKWVTGSNAYLFKSLSSRQCPAWGGRICGDRKKGEGSGVREV